MTAGRWLNVLSDSQEVWLFVGILDLAPGRIASYRKLTFSFYPFDTDTTLSKEDEATFKVLHLKQ